MCSQKDATNFYPQVCIVFQLNWLDHKDHVLSDARYIQLSVSYVAIVHLPFIYCLWTRLGRAMGVESRGAVLVLSVATLPVLS